MIANEIQLLRRCRQRDTAAWSELYAQFYPRVYGFLMARVRDSMLAEDLAADVFISALRAIESYEERGLGLATWIFRIAHNRLIDHYRRSALRANDSLDELVGTETLSASNEHLLDPQHSEQIDLNQAMEQLRPEQRQVIYLRFIEGQSSEQVAAVLGKSVAAVKISQHRALKALRTLMGQKTADA